MFSTVLYRNGPAVGAGSALACAVPQGAAQRTVPSLFTTVSRATPLAHPSVSESRF